MDDIVILPAYCLHLIDSWWSQSSDDELAKRPFVLRHDVKQWCKETMKQQHHIMYLTSRPYADDTEKRGLRISKPYIVFENRADMVMFRIAFPEITKES